MSDFFLSHLYFIPVLSWFAAVGVKWAVLYYQKRFTVKDMLGSGGMPSVHSALVTSLATAIGIKHGVDSDLFVICLAFASIIIYDAINVRFEAGRHAQALNILTQKEEKEFNESIGHLPKEAFAGSCIGILTAVITLSI